MAPRNGHEMERGARGIRARGSQGYRRSTNPVQFGVTMVLLASLLLLAMAAITRFTVGEPIIPNWLAKAIHRPQPSLPPGMTYDFQVINPDTKRPFDALPEIGTIEMRLAVTNDSALPMTVHFKSGDQCEFTVRKVIYYVDGLFALPLEVWRSSYFHNISRKPSVLSLQPGETKVYTASYELTALNARQMPPGSYRIIASFNGWQTSIAIDKEL
jgi:Intracellular proteinase inhibitor